MDETIISWNMPNWITICAMVVVGYAMWQTVKRLAPSPAQAQ